MVMRDISEELWEYSQPELGASGVCLFAVLSPINCEVRKMEQKPDVRVV